VLGQLGQELEEDLFAAALALPAPERASYLKRACSSNIDLLSRLTALVDAFGDAKGFIPDLSSDVCIGLNQIGPYRLLQELGEGGCGVAYLAEQAAPVRRQVALKIIKPGMDTKAVIARFEAERQVLALLDHPNIAKVFDAGATLEGRPYFVMELVRGIRITEYCEQCHMTIPQRLELFIQVCQAIQHAHQKGIIHRDIKPSNVLVTMHDGLPVAKVIDFGIAKATQGRLIDQTLHTEIDQIMGTPAYISPEQTQPGQAAIDTRSDIYSLGVLLYELLTSHTPFEARDLAALTIEQLRERIRTEEPPRPSRRLNSFDKELLARIATASSSTPVQLLKEVQDDLDWIIMQCLEKDASRRYQTVNEFVADLQRHLHHDPVRARPPSMMYTLRKLARRNRIAFISASASVVFVLSIVAFAVVMTIQAQRIATERDRAEREREEAQKVSNVVLNIFAIADPYQSLDSKFSGAALLDQAAKSVERELRDQPVTRARLLRAIGLAYTRRGEFKRSVAYLTDAVRVLSQMKDANSEKLTAMVDLSYALRISGDLQGARELLVRGSHLAMLSGLEHSAEYARLLKNRARIAIVEGNIPEAQTDLNSSLELYRNVVGAQSADVAEVLGDLSETFIWLDNHAEAERLARKAISIFEVTVPSVHPDRVLAESVLSEALYLQNRPDEAAALLIDAVRKDTELFGYVSPQVADMLDRLASVRYSQRLFTESETLAREALKIARDTFGQNHVQTGMIATTLSITLIRLQKYAEAEIRLREALTTLAATVQPDNQYIAAAEYFLGEVLLATKRPGQAEAILTASMHRWQRAGAPPWRAMRSASALGEALYRQGRTQEGVRYLTESLSALSTDANADPEAKEKAHERFSRYVKKSPKSTPSAEWHLRSSRRTTANKIYNASFATNRALTAANSFGCLLASAHEQSRFSEHSRS
jgi:eukaryotic-like serine/threonine-protein kinase